MAVPKIKLKEIVNKLEAKLKEEVKELPQEHQREVTQIKLLNSFTIPNSFGIYGILPIGGDFSDPKAAESIIQNHDVAIGLVVAMRPVHNHPEPYEYVEFALDALTGLYLENNRPERLVYPVKWEPMDERWFNNEQWYRIIFNCPVDHYEKRFEEQL